MPERATRPFDHFGTSQLDTGLGRRSARAGLLTASSQVAKFGLSLVSAFILGRLLTPQDYGLVGMVTAITLFISMYKDLGLSTATVQRADITHEEVSTLFWINVVLGVVLTVLTAAISPLLVWFYGEPRLGAMTVTYALGFLVGGATVQHDALLRRQMRFTALVVIELASLGSGFASAVLLAWSGAGYWSLVLSQLAMGTVNLVGVWMCCSWRPGTPGDSSGVRAMLVFGRNLTGFATLNYISRNIDNILIGRFWGAAELGYYSRAYQLLLLPIEQVNAPITAVAVPALSRLAHDPERYRHAYRRIIEKVALITMPGVAVMIGTADWFVPLLLGPQWGRSATLFAILGLTGLIQPLANTNGWLFVTQNQTGRMLKWGVFAAPVTTAAIIAGLRGGAYGVAVGYTSAAVVTQLLSFWYVGRIGIVTTRDIARAALPGAVSGAAALLGLFLVRPLLAQMSAPLACLGGAAVGVMATTLVLALLPQGRRAVGDWRNVLQLLRTGN